MSGLSELEFSDRGKLAVKEIRRIKEINQWLSSTIVVGTFANIFAGNGIIKSHYNLTQTDFNSFNKALRDSPSIAKRTIKTISGLQAIRAKTSKERQFWKAVYNGCVAAK
ncbi:hypothetical protein MHM93_05495 [Pseudoalteromonas sp. MM17-2]|uniref:hypothetical protein n=1 Tax=Pseudoalteromonas sp. MM17-2 TaxID=2917753 RepID=UPI001EF4674B|nr:hypothetical protein [Pseudoalteromonas sp. MM17-2]MCG7543637.1 hypothetical protein [Pseudoalteromonas sp. MM17-2]